MKPQRGFTLMELMITVAIVAILATVAYPSYRNQIMRSYRAEARSELLQIQVAQEKYFLQNNKYGTLAQLGLTAGTTYNTAHGYYKITLPARTDTTYTVQADALGSQATDTTCASYTITEVGAKTPTTAGCWK